MDSTQIIKLQKCILELKDDITDILHATSLNHLSLLLHINTDSNPIFKSNIISNKKVFQYQQIQSKFIKIQSQFQARSQKHLNYLIVKQIQQQELSVRKDRLMDYQDKIYDLRRLISDKQTFLESLYRPKKKRPQHMPLDDFHQMRAKQRASQELTKLQTMNKQKKSLQKLKKMLQRPSEQVKFNQNYATNQDNKKCLDYTKTSSIDNVNVNNLTSVAINETYLQEPMSQTVGISQLNIPMCRRHSTNQVTKKNNNLQHSNNVSIFASSRKSQKKQITVEKINRIKVLIKNINKIKNESIQINLERLMTQKQNNQLKGQISKYRDLYNQKSEILKKLKLNRNQSRKNKKKQTNVQSLQQTINDYQLWI